MKPGTRKLLQLARRKAARLTRKGWTKADFARALREELDPCEPVPNSTADRIVPQRKHQ